MIYFNFQVEPVDKWFGSVIANLLCFVIRKGNSFEIFIWHLLIRYGKNVWRYNRILLINSSKYKQKKKRNNEKATAFVHQHMTA